MCLRWLVHASVTDLAEAAIKGSSNTARGKEIGGKKSEGNTLSEKKEVTIC